MTTELIPSYIETPATSNEDDFNKLASSSFLPRLQLCGGNSDLAKTGKIGMGSWAWVLSKDTAIDLGKKVTALVLGWRPKAVSMNEPILTSYDMESDLFKKIKVDSEVSDSRAMYGPEFLVWIPEQGFGTYHAASKSARRSAPSILQILKDRKVLVLGAELVQNKNYKWHAAIITASSTPLPSYPEQAQYNEQLERFKNPAETKVELAPEGARDV
jgi:hypothetical protein